MKKILKKDFTIDFYNNNKINISEYREILKLKNNKKNFYISEIANIYYLINYKKSLVDVLWEFFKDEIPVCPISKHYPSYKFTSGIIFGKFSSNCSPTEISNYVKENNEDYKRFVDRIKIERRGSGNPMFKKTPWNKNLNKTISQSVRNISIKKKGLKPSEETKNKQSESAKKRKIHGHTGKKHTDETKRVLREKTLDRLVSGKFPKTNTFPQKKVKDWLCEFFGNNFEYNVKEEYVIHKHHTTSINRIFLVIYEKLEQSTPQKKQI